MHPNQQVRSRMFILSWKSCIDHMFWDCGFVDKKYDFKPNCKKKKKQNKNKIFWELHF